MAPPVVPTLSAPQPYMKQLVKFGVPFEPSHTLQPEGAVVPVYITMVPVATDVVLARRTLMLPLFLASVNTLELESKDTPVTACETDVDMKGEGS